MEAIEGLTVCSLVLPVLDPPALLDSLGFGVRRTIAGLSRFALRRRMLSHGMSHPPYRVRSPVYCRFKMAYVGLTKADRLDLLLPSGLERIQI